MDPEDRLELIALLAKDETWDAVVKIGRTLLERLCECARAAGYTALYGYILDANREMLDLAARLGFVEDGRDGNQVAVVRRL